MSISEIQCPVIVSQRWFQVTRKKKVNWRFRTKFHQTRSSNWKLGTRSSRTLWRREKHCPIQQQSKAILYFLYCQPKVHRKGFILREKSRFCFKGNFLRPLPFQNPYYHGCFGHNKKFMYYIGASTVHCLSYRWASQSLSNSHLWCWAAMFAHHG